MKRFLTRGVPGVAAAALALGLVLAACAPAAPTDTGGGGPTTSAPSTTLPTLPISCTTGATGTVKLGGGTAISTVPVGWPHTDTKQQIDACFNFGTAGAGHAVYLDECFKIPSDPHFDVFTDCSGINEGNLNPNENLSGKGDFLFDFFRGANPETSSWGIFGPGDSTTGTPAAGVYTTGYLRATLDTPSNNTQAIFVAFTFA
jgi:hypothetical protein